MTDHAAAPTRELLAELARLDHTIRHAPTVVNPTDAGSALTPPQFLHLLNQQLVLIGELRRRRGACRAALATHAAPDAAALPA